MKKIISFIILSISIIITFAGCGQHDQDSSQSDEQKIVRIGYQKNGPLIILKSLGTLDERLAQMNYKVEWIEFQAGPLLVEALNADGIDFGRTGNAPVIFAQAADVPFVYVATGYSKYKGSGILVPEDSNIEKLADLKGKKVSFAKGSSSHYLIVKALEKVNLSLDDITEAYLNPGDARVAFEQGMIDAMVVWDPYVASTEIHSNGKLLVDGEGLTTDRDFFVATRKFNENHPEIIEIILNEMRESSNWANENHVELVEMLSPILNIDEASVMKSVKRRIYGLEEISEGVIHEQQEIADVFYNLEIIPEKLNVRDVMEK